MASNVVTMAPRAPIVFSDSKSGALDAPDQYISSCRRWRDAAREEAIRTLKMNPEWEYIRDYVDMLEGRYWQKRRPSYRSRFFDNRLAEARIEALSALTDIRPSMEVSCSSNVEQYRVQAEIAQKVILAEWARLNLDLKVRAAVDHALLTVGYWKVGASMGPGRFYVLPCGIDSVLPIQPGFDIQDSSAVLYRAFQPMHRVKRMYGKAAGEIDKEVSGGYLSFMGGNYPTEGQIPEYSFSAINPIIRSAPPTRGNFTIPQEGGPFPVVEVEEYYIDDCTINESRGNILVKDPRLELDQHNYHYLVPPGERLFPRKRLLVMCGNSVLYDGPAPYWHGLYPFPQLVLNPAVWRNGGISKYRNLTPLQNAMNQLGAGVLDISGRCVDPQIAFVDGAVDDTSFRRFYGDMPAAQIKLNPNARVGEHIKYMDPPALPGYVGAFWDRLDRAFDRGSGAIDVSGMQRKNQVPGGEVWEQVRDASQSAFRLESRNIEPFMREAGSMCCSNVFQFFRADQRMAMLGKDGLTWEDFDYDAGTMVPFSAPKEDHWRKFPIRIAAGSMHGGHRDRDKQLAVSGFRLGLYSRKEALRRLDTPNIEQIEKEIAEENQGSLVPNSVGKGATPRLNKSVREGNPF